MALFKVPQPSEEKILELADYKIKGQIRTSVLYGAKSALYSIGMGEAEARASTTPKSTRYDVYNNSDIQDYKPDAVRNNIGGYNQTAAWDGYMSSSLSGMPVMSYIKFVGGTYRDLKGDLVTIPDILFETVLLTITFGKRLVMSEVAGRDEGDIIEYIGGGNHKVEISAIITADAPVNKNVQWQHQTGAYPRGNMLEIFKMLSCPVAIPVESWYLQQAGINYLVVDDGAVIEQLEGEYTMQKLTIPCISDNPLVITIAD